MGNQLHKGKLQMHTCSVGHIYNQLFCILQVTHTQEGTRDRCPLHLSCPHWQLSPWQPSHTHKDSTDPCSQYTCSLGHRHSWELHVKDTMKSYTISIALYGHAHYTVQASYQSHWSSSYCLDNYTNILYCCMYAYFSLSQVYIMLLLQLFSHVPYANFNQ